LSRSVYGEVYPNMS